MLTTLNAKINQVYVFPAFIRIFDKLLIAKQNLWGMFGLLESIYILVFKYGFLWKNHVYVIQFSRL
jgi:hypothetical protein